MERDVEQRFERIEALVESGFRKSELRFQKVEARSDRLEARFEKRMKGFEKLVTIGMKELAQMRRAQRETEVKLNALIEAQQRTEASLKRFIDSLVKGTNGH